MNKTDKIALSIVAAALLILLPLGFLVDWSPPPSADEQCRALLEEHGWTVSSQWESVPYTGAAFLTGSDVWDPFRDYVVEVQKLDIRPEDELEKYRYTLKEMCIQRSVDAFFLMRDAQVISSALFSSETVYGIGSTFNDADCFYPLDMPLSELRVIVIKKMLANAGT
jgi:hypothetical protein